MTSHPECSKGHVCHVPNGLTCFMKGCSSPAGTYWSNAWCPVHDEERLDRVHDEIIEILKEVDTMVTPATKTRNKK